MRFQRSLLTLLTAIVLVLGIAACAAPAATPTPQPDTGSTTEPTPAPDMGEGSTDDSNGMPTTGEYLGNWNASEIGGEPINPTLVPTLTFNENGEVAGNGGCNGYGGTYRADGTNMTISGVVSTMMACEEQALMTQESSFLGALQMVTTYTVDGDTLSLLDADGNAIVVLTRA
jgi:heat shock protein HslJ